VTSTNEAQEAFHAAKREVLDEYIEWIGGKLIAAAKIRAEKDEFDADQSTRFMAEVDVHTTVLQLVLDERNKSVDSWEEIEFFKANETKTDEPTWTE